MVLLLLWVKLVIVCMLVSELVLMWFLLCRLVLCSWLCMVLFMVISGSEVISLVVNGLC